MAVGVFAVRMPWVVPSIDCGSHRILITVLRSLHRRLIINVASKDTRRTVPLFLLDGQVAHFPYQPLLLHLEHALVLLLDLALKVLLMQIHILGMHLIVHVLGVCWHLMNVLRLCHFIIFKTILATYWHLCIELLLAVSIHPICSLGPATSVKIWRHITKHLAILCSLFRTLDSVG